MLRWKQMVVLLFVIGFATMGCTKADKPMPLTKVNLSKYLAAVTEASNSVSAKDTDEAQTNLTKRAEIMTIALVKPLEKMGYNYDKTVQAAAQKLISKDVPASDEEFAMMLFGFLNVPSQMKDFFVQYKLISPETKDLLTKAITDN